MYQAAGGLAEAVIVIHSNNTMPFPDDHGTVLTPGAYNAIRIHLKTIKSLPYPYGDCVTTESDESYRDDYISL